MSKEEKRNDVFENLESHEQKLVEDEVKREGKVDVVLPAPKSEKIKIVIEEQEGDENQGSVFVSVNGYAYLIKRGFPVEVVPSVVNVLKDAVITRIYMNPDTGETTYKDVPRFNFRILDK